MQVSRPHSDLLNHKLSRSDPAIWVFTSRDWGKCLKESKINEGLSTALGSGTEEVLQSVFALSASPPPSLTCTQPHCLLTHWKATAVCMRCSLCWEASPFCLVGATSSRDAGVKHQRIFPIWRADLLPRSHHPTSRLVQRAAFPESSQSIFSSSPVPSKPSRFPLMSVWYWMPCQVWGTGEPKQYLLRTSSRAWEGVSA